MARDPAVLQRQGRQGVRRRHDPPGRPAAAAEPVRHRAGRPGHLRPADQRGDHQRRGAASPATSPSRARARWPTSSSSARCRCPSRCRRRTTSARRSAPTSSGAACWPALIGLLLVVLYSLLQYRAARAWSPSPRWSSPAVLTYGRIMLLGLVARLPAHPGRRHRPDRRRSASPPTRSSSTSNGCATRSARAGRCAPPSRPAGSAPGARSWPPTRSTSWPPPCSTSWPPATCAASPSPSALTTLIDVLVVFLFTHPLVAMLARTKFFGEGHKWSGLDPEHLGHRRSEVRRPWPGHDRRAARRGRGRPRLMSRFAAFGNDLYTGERSIDFVGRQQALVRHLGGDPAALARRARSAAGSTSGSSSGAARSSGSPASRTARTLERRGRAASRRRADGADVTVTKVGTRPRSACRPTSSATTQTTRSARPLAKAFGVPEESVTASFVGASWGQSVTQQGAAAA